MSKKNGKPMDREMRNLAAKHAIAFLRNTGNREQQAKDWAAAQDCMAVAHETEKATTDEA